MQKFVFTSFDKAIVAAIAGPIIVFLTSYLDGVAVFDTKSFVAAVLAGLGAGLAVYAKTNLPTVPPATK